MREEIDKFVILLIDMKWKHCRCIGCHCNNKPNVRGGAIEMHVLHKYSPLRLAIYTDYSISDIELFNIIGL